MSSPILFAYELGTKQGIVAGDADSLLKSQTPAWVHIDYGHEEAQAWVEKYLELDEHRLEALLDEDARPRAIRDGEATLLLLRGVNLNQGSNPEDMVTLRIYADEKRIITLRRRNIMAVADMEQEFKKTNDKVTVGDVLSDIIDRLLERMEPVIDSLDDQLDLSEEKVIEQADSELRASINQIRKQAIMLRRYIAPQRDAIQQLRQIELPWMSKQQREELAESYNYVQRYVETLDAIRERAQVVKDELANILSDRMNRNTYVLTVVAAVFLPISFLTGLLGINVGGIPGAESNRGFIIFSTILLAVVLLQIFIFKKKKWF